MPSPAVPSGSGDALFGALADPTRRTIVELLLRGGSSTATNLAAELAISRQAVAKHLDKLAASGLAVPRRVGRETRYRLDPRPLDDVTRWVATVQSQWTDRLELLRASLDDPEPGGPSPPAD